ncbi:exonuclease [Corynebacterium phage phi674]|uniref:Uncharacterized protein n=1 Tax=Corynebacterium phage phi674 TaxID=2052822 RepID=A0A2H4PJ00_9CAUD|nr:exonuclease [Corynebacterium phage phi674]ATW62957.1 hypothetical protein phi674_gp39 [Corynebacterium phage phi674]
MTTLSLSQVTGSGLTPDAQVIPARPAAPQIPRFTPPGWRGHRTHNHGFPMPPERAGGKETVAKYGKYELPHPETGKPAKFPRATSLAHAIDSKDGLIKWLQRTTVLGLKTQPDLLDDLDLFDDPRNVNQSVDKIIDRSQLLAGNSEASERGTAIHAWTEEVECYGLPLEDVPEIFRPKIQAYMQCLSEYGITTPPGMVERLVWNPQAEHVGTLDRIWKLADDTLVIGDVKTSKTTSLKYGLMGFAMQTAIYAGAEAMWNPETQSWDDMPAISNAFSVVAHIPSDRDAHCELITLDLTEGRHALDLALQISEMRTRSGSTIPGQWDIPKPEKDLKQLVLSCTTQQELATLWQAHQDVWTEELTQLGMSHLRGIASQRLH